MKTLKLSVILGLIILSLNSYSQVDQDQLYKFNQVIDNIMNFYVDSVSNEKLIEDAITSMLKELDPHSVYYSKEEVEEINRGLVGSFVGVGITYDIIKDTVFVLSVIANGPSETAGLLPGDRIVQVNAEIIAGTGIDDKKLKDLLSGKKGSKVSVTIKRRGHKKLKDIIIKRDKIPVKSIDAAYNFNNVSYIKLNRFSATSIQEFKYATDTLINENTDKLVLDLRNNTGGYLYVSIKLLEYFLDYHTKVLYTKGVHSKEREYKTQKEGKYKDIDLVVLINEASASASEIVSGAIQDWDRGIIVGRRSFGKGLVQKPIYLIDSSMMRLTIAKYYTPSGRNIQKPYDNGYDEYRNEVSSRLENGELMNKDSIKYNDSLRYYTLNNKRMIFGGGGIMPDIFIPVDTLRYPHQYRKQYRAGILNEFIHLFVDKHRKEFYNSYSDFETYKSQFVVKVSYLKELANYISETTELKEKCFNEIKNHGLVKIQVKALIAYDLFGESEYFQIINQKDEFFLKAVEILNNKELYTDILHNDIVGEYNNN